MLKILRDICNSSEYIRVQNNCQYGITLMLNTDGISLSRSSKTKLYSLLYTICEIPSELRSSFIILTGVWCDTEQPPMNIFLRVFVDSLIDIHNKGVSWTHPDNSDSDDFGCSSSRCMC